MISYILEPKSLSPDVLMHIVSLLPAEALAISGRWDSLCGMTLVCIHLEFVINLNTFPERVANLNPHRTFQR